MAPSMNVIVTLALTGFALCICAGVVSLIWRREEVTSAALWWAGSDLAAHPERYVRPDRVAVVRALCFAGVGLILAAVVVLVALTLGHPR